MCGPGGEENRLCVGQGGGEENRLCVGQGVRRIGCVWARG